MTDPVTEGLADGLRPSTLADTISVQEAAAINIAAKLGRLEKLQERAVEAAERQAGALETFVQLFASCIGVATAWCPGEPETSPAVNYIRSGKGEPFRCDATGGDDDDHD